MTRATKRHPLDGLLTVMWHYVRRPDETPAVGATWVDPDVFEAQLAAIGREREVVGWPAVAEALDGGRPVPPDAALLTFDDGLADHARTVAPRLLARGWTGLFFVLARAPGEPLTVGHALHVLLADLGATGLAAAVADRLSAADADRFATAQRCEAAAGVGPLDVVKRPLQRDLLDVVEPILHRLVGERLGPPGDVADTLHLSAADLATMAGEGLAIGGHGRRHVWFDHAPTSAVRDELRASAALLARGPRPWAFAYPYGASSRFAVDALAEDGFAAAFRAAPRPAAGPFDLGRIDAEDATFASLIAVGTSAGATR